MQSTFNCPVIGPLSFAENIRQQTELLSYHLWAQAQDNLWHFNRYCLKIARPRHGAYSTTEGSSNPVISMQSLRPNWIVRLFRFIRKAFVRG